MNKEEIDALKELHTMLSSHEGTTLGLVDIQGGSSPVRKLFAKYKKAGWSNLGSSSAGIRFEDCFSEFSEQIRIDLKTKQFNSRLPKTDWARVAGIAFIGILVTIVVRIYA